MLVPPARPAEGVQRDAAEDEVAEAASRSRTRTTRGRRYAPRHCGAAEAKVLEHHGH